MKKVLFCLTLVVLCSNVFAQPSKPFTPGNLVLVDAAEDRLIEVKLEETQAVVQQVVKWPLGDTSRRRPLGVAFDPNGTCYVGVTGVPTSATEAVEFPSGRGEVLRIFSDGSIDFKTLPVEVNKATWVSSFNANEVFMMSNDTRNQPVSQSYRLRFSGLELTNTTLFNLSATVKTNGSLASGKALQLPDGRILIPSESDVNIKVYSQDGGDPVGEITTGKAYSSLAYLPASDELLAILPNNSAVDRINMEGTVLGTFDFTLDGLGGVWNFTLMEDGSERFIATNHNGPAGSKSQIFIYDSSNLNDLPIPDIIPIVGLEGFGDADGLATQLFDHSFVPVPSSVSDWSLQ
ncbi:MAG: hypothetical protein GC154_02395 [bacterium]|nr:hypothetical protein [bacterium]